MLHKIKENYQYILFVICFYMFFLQCILQNNIEVFKYWDEFYSILFIPLFIIKNKKEGILKKEDKLIFTYCLIIIIIGLIGNIIYKYQELGIAIMEIILIFKFVLSYYTTKLLFDGLEVYDNKKIALHAKVVTIILVILNLIDYAFDIFPHGIRYGIYSQTLFFGHQTAFSAMVVFNLSILLLTDSSNKKWIYILLNIFLIISTLLTKALIFVVVFGFCYIWTVILNKKTNIKRILLVMLLILLIGFPRFYYFFLGDLYTARLALLETSVKIANDNFPVGGGFATFGTNLSGKHYAKTYDLYKISGIHGLRIEKPSFVSDTFWPAILGQFGYSGLLYFLLILYKFWKKIKEKYKLDRNVFIAAFTPFIYLMISSIAEASFIHTVSVPLFFAISLAIKTSETKNQIGENMEDNYNANLNNKRKFKIAMIGHKRIPSRERRRGDSC